MRGKEEMGRSGEGKSWWRGQERERGDGEVRRGKELVGRS